MSGVKLNVTVVAKNGIAETAWARELEPVFDGLAQVYLKGSLEDGKPGQLIFVDGTEEPEGIPAVLKDYLAKIERGGRAIFLIIPESAARSEALEAGLVDDVLTYPFRPLDVMSRIRHYQQLLMWDEVQRLNASFSELISQIREDLSLAERMQKAKLPRRFPEVRGFQVTHRTLVGWRSGDYIDLAESRDGSQLSMVLSDSSSSRLSSAVLGVLMRVAVKLSTDEVRSSLETVRKIHDELALMLGEKDRLSLFYGVVSRKDYRLRYVNFGNSAVFRALKGKGFELLPVQGPAISSTAGFPPGGAVLEQGEIELQAEDRLVLLSDGFVDAIGGASDTLRLLNDFRDRDATDLINELTYRVKSQLESEDDLPSQDCTAVLFDVADRLIRLAK